MSLGKIRKLKDQFARKNYLHKRFDRFISPITQIVILFLLYVLDILQKIKRSVIIEKTVSNNIQKKLITMMVSMMLPYTFFIYLPKRFRVKSNKIHKRTISTFTAFNNILS